jgi:hypothetical protein
MEGRLRPPFLLSGGSVNLRDRLWVEWPMIEWTVVAILFLVGVVALILGGTVLGLILLLLSVTLNLRLTKYKPKDE